MAEVTGGMGPGMVDPETPGTPRGATGGVATDASTSPTTFKLTESNEFAGTPADKDGSQIRARVSVMSRPGSRNSKASINFCGCPSGDLRKIKPNCVNPKVRHWHMMRTGNAP